MTAKEIIAKLKEANIEGQDLYGALFIAEGAEEKIHIENIFGRILPEQPIALEGIETGEDIVINFADHNVLISISASWDDFYEDYKEEEYESDFREVEKVIKYSYVAKG